MWPFRQKPLAPSAPVIENRRGATPAPALSGGIITIKADTRSIRRARTRLADLRQAHAWHLARPASEKRRKKLGQLEGAIRQYESALDEVRATLTGES